MTIKSTFVETVLAEQGLTKSAYAELCGISRQSLSTILRRGSAAPKTVGKLAAGLGVPVADIIKAT